MELIRMNALNAKKVEYYKNQDPLNLNVFVINNILKHLSQNAKHVIYNVMVV